MKDILWVGSARTDLRAMPGPVRHEIGVDLRLIQAGENPRDWRPMPAVGAGVTEVRVRTDEIRRIIETRKLTQAGAAKILGITQPRVSDLVRGRIDLFSIDTLVDFLARLGVEVTLRTTRRSRVV